MKKVIFFLVLLLSASNGVFAQCAMCRSTLENNLSNGDPGLAAGLNIGILYLLILPYLAIVVIAILWYKSTKHGGKELRKRVAGG